MPPTTQWWYNILSGLWRSILVTLLCIASIFLVWAWSLRREANDNIAASQYAKDVSIDLASNTISGTLHLRYPIQLYHGADPKDRRPITAWLTGLPTSGITETYTITFEHNDRLVFTDLEGNLVAPLMTLETNSFVPPQSTLYLHPAPFLETSAMTSEVALKTTVISPRGVRSLSVAPLTITTETPDNSRYRLIWGRLARDVALPITLILALVPLIDTYLQRQQEQKAQTQRAQLQTIRSLLPTAPEDALHQLYRLKSQMSKWGRLEQIECQQLIYDLRTIPFYKEALLRSVSEALRQGKETVARTILRDMEWLFAEEEFGRNMRVLRSIADTNPLGVFTPTQMASAIIDVWRTSSDDAREVVVWCAGKLYARYPSDGENALRQKAITPSDRRLLRDPRLMHIAPDLLTRYDYTLPPAPAMPPVEREQVLSWLSLHELTKNPFAEHLVTAKLDGSMHRWPQFAAPQPTIMVGGTPYERVIVVQRLQTELDKVFIVPFELPIAEILAQAQPQAYLIALAHAVGATWTDLLHLHPGAFLELTITEQIKLAHLLTWSAGSYTKFRFRLHQAGLREQADGRVMLRQIEELTTPNESMPSPSEEDLIGWLSVRPPGMQTTYLIGVCHERSFLGEAQIIRLLRLVDNLGQGGVILKLFTAPLGVTLPLAFTVLPLKWEEAELKAILHSRLSEASGERPFGSMGAPADKTLSPFLPEAAQDLTDEVESRLVAAASGSLSAMLALGNALIATHLANHPAPDASQDPGSVAYERSLHEHRYWQEEDINAVLRQFQQTT